MRVSLNWLKEWVLLNEDAKGNTANEAAMFAEATTLGEELTMLGLELNSVEMVNAPIPGLYVGEVLTCEPHPQADRLKLTTIRYRDPSAGVREVPVICGALNIAAGQKIVYASIGTKLPGGLVIKEARIRGVVSAGMVCSLEELGKEAESETIWVLPEEAALEDDITKYMGAADAILDFDLLSNRGDTMSILGVAREGAALREKPLTLDESSTKTFVAAHAGKDALSVSVESKQDTPRYMLVRLSGVTVGASPRWVIDRLHTHGLRAINNVVDVTNLIMLEFGQPLHAFDAGRVRGDRIEVRRGRVGEKLLSLDDREVSLGVDDLIIADGEGPIGLAGLMGGKESGIHEGSTEVLLEAAYFDADAVRRTADRAGMDTDAGTRFIRRSADISLTATALARAVDLLERHAGAKVSSALSDSLSALPEKRQVTLSSTRLARDLGMRFEDEEVEKLLSRLGFTLRVLEKSKESTWEVSVPTYRHDIEEEWDLVEEVARLYGYNRLPVRLPRATHSDPSMIDTSEREALQHAVALGYDEIMTYPFVEGEFAKQIGMKEEDLLIPRNPIIQQSSILRSNMLYGALKTLRLNREKRHGLTGRYIEQGHVFSRKHPQDQDGQIEKNNHAQTAKGAYNETFGVDERSVVGWLRYLPTAEPHWAGADGAEKAEIDGYSLIGDLELFLERMIPRMQVIKKPMVANEASSLRFLVQKESGWLGVKGDGGENNFVRLGYWGRVDGAALTYFDIGKKERLFQHVYYGEIDLDVLRALRKKTAHVHTYTPVSAYPFLTRDIALVVTEDTPAGELLAGLSRAHEVVTDVSLIEVYRGEKLKEAQSVRENESHTDWDESTPVKSFVFRLELRSSHKTLLNAEADKIIDRIVHKLARRHAFKLR